MPATLRATRVVIADDHPLIRLAVRCELEAAGFEVSGEAADAAGAVASAVQVEPDVCVLDVSMPGDGVEAARRIRRALPGTRVLMLTSWEDEADLFEAMLAGASGFVGKETEPGRLPDVIRAVLRGEVVVPRAFVSVLVERLVAPTDVLAARLQPSA